MLDEDETEKDLKKMMSKKMPFWSFFMSKSIYMSVYIYTHPLWLFLGLLVHKSSWFFILLHKRRFFKTQNWFIHFAMNKVITTTTGLKHLWVHPTVANSNLLFSSVVESHEVVLCRSPDSPQMQLWQGWHQFTIAQKYFKSVDSTLGNLQAQPN